ncbi:MAG: hypothetical protein ABFD46_04880 [Armatimonadota bacterium]
MRFSNNNSIWSEWEAYSSSKSGWILTSGDGTKTVYAQYKNNLGEVSASYSDTILLDTTNPDLCILNGYTYSSSTITLNYNGCYDNGSGVHHVELWYKLGTEGTWTYYASIASSAPGSFNFVPPAGEGMYYFDLVAEDNACNRSPLGWEDCSTIYGTTVGICKLMPDDADVIVNNAVVTATFTGNFYIESEDRFSGIKVNSTAAVAVGDMVDIVGVIDTDSNDERCITASTVTIDGTGTIIPLGMNNRTVGGGDFEYCDPGCGGQRGITEVYAWNNIGMLIRTYGNVAAIGLDYLYIDDGSALEDGSYNTGIKVMCTPPAGVVVGDHLVVTGISSCFENGSGNLERLILTRSASDITEVTTGESVSFTLYYGSSITNWISLSCAPLNSDPAAVFPYNPNGCLYRWNSLTNGLVIYDEDYPEGFGGMLLGDGYKASVTQQCQVNYAGYPDGLRGSNGLITDMAINLSSYIEYQAGATWIGHPLNHKVLWTDIKVTNGMDTLSVQDAITEGWIDDNWTYYVAQTGSTYYVDPTGSNGSAYLEPGRMYLVYSNLPNLTLIIPADRTAPAFTDIAANPTTIKYGDSSRQTTTITFTASEELKENPAVTVNGNSAANLSHNGLNYTCTYTVLSTDPVGLATIVITGMDMAGNEAQDTNADALLIGVVTAYTYDSTGNRTVVNPNGTRTIYTYDERYRLKEVEHQRLVSSQFSMFKQVNYNLDGVGNRVKTWLDNDEANLSTVYTYDVVNRLTSAASTNYSYDWVGNLFSKYNGGAWDYSIVDMLTERTSGSDTYTYRYAVNPYTPGAGNLLEVKKNDVTSRTYTYDSRGLLSTASGQ